MLRRSYGRRGRKSSVFIGWVVVQSGRSLRTGLPFEASPPGPLSVTGEGGKQQEAASFFLFPPLLSGRGGQGLRRADPFEIHRQTEPLPIGCSGPPPPQDQSAAEREQRRQNRQP